MKVVELKKINAFAKDNEIRLNYENLLKYEQKDIDLIIENIENDNKNIIAVIDFINWELDTLDWKNKFNHLEGIGKFNIREYLMEKMIKAPSIEIARMIYNYFDLDDCDSIVLFHTVEEWKTFIENITDMIGNIDTSISNIKLVLTKAKEDRCELIEQIMRYSKENNRNLVNIGKVYGNEIIDKHLKEILSLLLKEYDAQDIYELFNNFENNLASNEGIERRISNINLAYSKLIDYLIKNNYNAEEKTALIRAFNCADYSQYTNIICLLTKIDKNGITKLFDLYLERKQLDNENMQLYIRNILHPKIEYDNHKEAYLKRRDIENVRYSLISLLEHGVIDKNIRSKEAIESIIKFINIAQEQEGKCNDMATFLIKVPYFEIVSSLQFDYDFNVREVLYEEFPKFIRDGNLSEEQIENYRDWLEKLQKLPIDACIRVMKILNLPFVKNMNIEEQNSIKELVLNPENFASLYYICSEYEKKSEEYEVAIEDPLTPYNFDPKVKLLTVLDLLNQSDDGSDIDKVLAGFKDDDEITEKTLIRSLAYKDNQNN